MGTASTYDTGTSCNASCPSGLKQLLRDITALVKITKDVVGRFFPPTTSTAPFVSKLGYSVSLPPAIYVLLVYGDLYPNHKLDNTNVIDLLNLKDIYLMLNLPWQNDRILADAVLNGLI